METRNHFPNVLRLLPLALLLFLLWSGTMSACAADISADPPERPIVTADKTEFNPHTGRYHLSGHVQILSGDRIITMDDAQISPTLLEIWGQGNVQLQRNGSDLTLQSDAIYVECYRRVAGFFGKVHMQRIGLSVHANTAVANWNTHVINFEGHVIWNRNGKERVATSLDYNYEQDQIL